MNNHSPQLEASIKAQLNERIKAGSTAPSFAVIGGTDRSFAMWGEFKNKLGAKNMKKSDIYRDKLAGYEAEMNSFVTKSQSGDLSPTELGRMLALGGDPENGQGGLVAEYTDLYQAAVADEAATREYRASRMANVTPIEPVFDRTGARPIVNAGPNARVIEPKLSCFANSSDAYDAGLWLKANVLRDPESRQKLEARRGSSWLASQNETSPVDGGYLVPAPLSNAIIVAREQVGACRKLAQVYPCTSDSLAVPKRVSGLTVYYPGEEGSITDSDMDFGQISLQPKKRAVLTYVSNELKDDSIVPVMDVLAAEMGHALGLKEDQEFILGDATSTYGGVLGVKESITAATASISQFATGHDTWGEIDLSDLTQAMSKVSDKYRIPGQLSWLCSAAFKWQVMDRLAIGANGAISQQWVNGQPVEMFLGYPVVLSDRCPTSGAAATLAAYFGNFKQAVALGDRTGIRVALSEHVAFTTDRLALRATTRYDINVHGAGDASTAGAIVGLKTAA